MKSMHVTFEKGFENFMINIAMNHYFDRYHVIIGPSGSGKTLTLRFIAGLEKGKGTINIDGRDFTNLTPRERKIVYIPQGDSLFPHFSVKKNLLAGVKYGKADYDESLFEKIVEVFKIKNFLHRYPHTLSAGEKQRVILGRALMVKPLLLLLDEPFSSLDFHIKLELIEFLKIIKREFGISFIHVTHDPVEAKLLSEYITVIEKGKITFAGEFTSLVNEPVSDFTGKIADYFSYLK